jgi:heterodisulfide reductase subunit A-like polyferredoxin
LIRISNPTAGTMEPRMGVEKSGAVLVCGAGVSGIQASLDLAEGGFKVYLLDSAPAIGGRMSQLDRIFPTGDCAICILSPKLVECARNRNIEIITLAEVQSVSGRAGNFKVKIRQNPRNVDIKKCEACGDCAKVCPVDLPNEYDRGLSTRKAIFRPYPQAIPGVYSISKSADPAPCKGSCPAGVNVPGYVALTAAGTFAEAYALIRRRCPLPGVCGRVCPHPCQDRCNRNEIDEAVSIRDLKRFVGDYVRENPDQYPPWIPPATRLDARIAVIGSGPAGLTASADLALRGYGVTLFEGKPGLGGMLRYGIPSYRLPKDVLDGEIEHILELGVEVRLNTPVAKPKMLLKSGAPSDGNPARGESFDAIFVATGAWMSRKLGIPGEDAPGVWEDLKFLCAVNEGEAPKIGPRVVVIGSTDMALDAARCALRLPNVESVRLACLESRAEMPAHSWEVDEALEEGIIFHEGLGPTRIETADGKTVSVVFRACTSVFDKKYRRFDPIFDDSKISSLPADTVIVAVGQGVDSSKLGLETRPGGRILADRETLATSIDGIFAGGGAVLGPASIADAMAQGHQAAEAIDAYVQNTAHVRRTMKIAVAESAPVGPGSTRFASNPRPCAPARERVRMRQTSIAERLEEWAEINLGYTAKQAMSEAGRCLSCALCSECLQCVQACSAEAVCHDQQPVELEIEVGSIIAAPGTEEFQASLWEEFGHGRYANVLSSLQFERMLSAEGPTGGRVRCPSDGCEAKRIAFIQCVGSRDPSRGRAYCSSICCMSACKEAMEAQESSPGGTLEISIFGMDRRASSKEFDSYLSRAHDECGVQYVQAIPSRVLELPDTKALQIVYVDPSGDERRREFDLVVLSSGLQVPSGAREMARRLGIELNDLGFARTQRLSPLVANLPGIYVAGAFQEPKDISESVTQASAAAACAMGQLTSVRGTLIQRHEYPWERDVTDEAPRIGVFVCHCGHNIASVIDVEQVARKAASMPGVRHAETSMYTCSDNSQKHIKEMIKRHRLNRLVVASCWSRTHEILFQETLLENGLNPYLLAMTNIRDHCSWVHRDDPAAATLKAIALVSMAVARARNLKALRNGEIPVTASALILGGGLAGMTAALSIAGQGYKVHLVEKERALGGLLRNRHSTLERNDIQMYLHQRVSEVQSHPEITVHLDATLTGISGQVGDFRSVLKVAGEEKTIRHGVVIVATGGRERSTGRFLYGKNPRVLTQSELESELAGCNLPNQLRDRTDPTVAMIQCVESRDDKNPYCSRVCCSEAIKNAIEIKRLLPRAEVIVLGRDIRTQGFRELYFQKARENGVLFIRYPDGHDPKVAEKDGKLEVTVQDAAANRERLFRPDMVVLSTGISPAADNPATSGMLRTALTADGFFMEAHSKLRPVDLANEGEFLCGLAHSPRFMDETIAQAQAAAGRATRILSKAQLEIAGQVAFVNPAQCIACATCVKICPYGAPTINKLGKSEIQGGKCMGCGNCAASCPARTITLQHQEGRVMTAMIDELLVAGRTV